MPGRKFAQMDTGAWEGEFLIGYYCPLYPLPFSPSMFQNEDNLTVKIRKNVNVLKYFKFALKFSRKCPLFP